MPGSIIEYSLTPTTPLMAPLSMSALLLAEQLLPIAAAVATISIASLSYHFLHGT